MEIGIKEEKNTEAYKETLDIETENIYKIENIHNYHKRHWREIYEAMQQEFFNETDISTRSFKKAQ